MKKLRMLLAALLITVFIIPYSATRAESTETPVNMSIDIMQDSTEAIVGETVTASWTYTAALPLDYYAVFCHMYYDDGTTESAIVTKDPSVISFSYTPAQSGRLVLSVDITGADNRKLDERVQWTIKETPTVPDLVPTSIDIVQDSTEAVIGETITASWTYTVALPLDYYAVFCHMYYDDGTTESAIVTKDPSVTSFSYTPAQSGRLVLSVDITGADNRKLDERVQWTIKETPTVPDLVPTSIDIVQDSTEAVIGETITASWTYTAALPLDYYAVFCHMYYDDGTTESAIVTKDPSVTSFSYTPAQSGRLVLSVNITGADNRKLDKHVRWTVSVVPNPIPGDADNDGATNINDAIAILQYLANGSANVNLRKADFNGDGEVNNYDVLLILQRVAGWN